MAEAKTLMDVQEILMNITFPSVRFVLHHKEDGYLIQAIFAGGDSSNQMEQRSGKGYISRYATTSEIVKRAMAIVMSAMEHEVRKHFRYKSCAIFNPSVNVEWLALQCDLGNFEVDVRDNHE